MLERRLLLLVTGSTLKAEMFDRPIAYRLRERFISALDARHGPERPGRPHPLVPVVCSDLWYLNNQALRARPTVCVGGPSVNALTAYLADKLPTVFAVEDEYIIQADPEWVDLAACCWGADARATLAAAEVFAERWIAPMLDEAAGQ